MSILKLKPACKDYLWGGHRLVDEYNVDYDGEILAEAWELSCHPDGPSMIMNGPYEGKSLREYLDIVGMEALGTHCRRFREFPILTKFIDARDNLSIQVHPNNGFALQNEGQYGKTEMWYVLDAEEGAFLYYGFKREITREEFARRIEENTLLEVLNAVPVKKGDVLFIESGTLHAIGKGILIAEIQQNSNVTYRVYDYGRVGKDGKKRDLHIEKALAVTSRVPIIRSGSEYPHVADCDYFTVDKLNLDGNLTYRMQGTVSEASFLSILILDGEGTISCKGESVTYRKGDSFFLAAGSGDWQIEGKCDALLTTIREKASPIRVGITIGSSETQIGLVNDRQQIIAMRKFPTDTEKEAEVFAGEVAQATLDLLVEQNVPLDQCIGVGAGVPGTIDRRKGKVLYSNNLRWEDVDLVKELGRVIAGRSGRRRRQGLFGRRYVHTRRRSRRRHYPERPGLRGRHYGRQRSRPSGRAREREALHLRQKGMPGSLCIRTGIDPRGQRGHGARTDAGRDLPRRGKGKHRSAGGRAAV